MTRCYRVEIEESNSVLNALYWRYCVQYSTQEKDRIFRREVRDIVDNRSLGRKQKKKNVYISLICLGTIYSINPTKPKYKPKMQLIERDNIRLDIHILFSQTSSSH